MSAAALVKAIAQKLYDEYGPFWDRPGNLPEGLRLELHPALLRLLMQDPEFFGPPRPDFTAPPQTAEEVLAKRAGVPVKASAELERDRFRLVIVTERELLGGRL